MVQFNFSERTIKAKVVYYGPAQSGKTTNLEQIHRLTDPAATNRLISLNTAQDRTLFFDLLPFSLGAVSGYDFKIQLYTVPGQVQYNATRRVVLAGADAVVFVADARRSLAKENQAAFENMKVNLLANRLVPEKVPLIFQYNKQDLPEVMSLAELSKTINPWGRPALGAVAAQGQGVIECFVAVVQDMLAAIAVKYNLKEKGLDPASVPSLAIQQDATRLKRGAAELGDPSAAAARGTGDPVASSRPPASTPTMTSSRSIPSPPARPAPPPPVPRAAAPPVPTPSAANGSLHELLQDVLGGAQDALDAQELSVDLRVPMTTRLPSCPPLALRQALVGTVEGLVTAALRGTQLSLRCERKPVLLKGRDGEVKRDFLMLALAH